MQECKTLDEEIAAGGCSSFDMMSSKGDDPKEMVVQGWLWTCIQSEYLDVDQFHSLPS